MCGIGGVLQFSGEPVVPDLLTRMSHMMRHRGPDGDGIYLDGALGLCHRRLAILDLSHAGHQPMHSGPGSPCISYNGECYNYRDLREGLRAGGQSFRSDGDTEVVLKGFAEHGPGFLGRMQGMFAFAFWNPTERALYLCRDRLGIKPLYYYLDRTRLVFASEIRPILEAGVEPVLNRDALQSYLRLRYVPGEQTLLAGIRRVDPGTYLRFTADGAVARTVFWSPDRIERTDIQSEAEASDGVFRLLSKAVDRRLQADVPVGAFLSGGLDSSAIVALMSRQNARVSAFTFAMSDDNDESPTAARVAAELNVEHRVISAGPDDYEVLERAILALEEPLGDAIIAPTYLLAQAAAEHVKVVLSGEGADELLAGYVHHAVLSHAHSASRAVPAASRRSVSRLLGAVPIPVWDRLFPYPGKLSAGGVRRFVDSFALADRPVEAYCSLIDLFVADERRQLFAPSFMGAEEAASVSLESRLSRGAPGTEPDDFLNQILDIDLRNWNTNYTLLRLDKLTMAHSLEARVPFLDHELVEHVHVLPGRLKVRGRERKRLLRRALAGRNLVSESVRTAPKRPFYLAFETSFGPGFDPFVEDLLGESAVRRRGIFNPRFVSRLRAEAGSDLLANKQLMVLIVFELWARLFLDGGWRRLSL